MTSEWTPFHIERPIPQLLRYYIVMSILSLCAFPITILPLYFKYHTLRYRFDAEGIRMSWGILFRREIFLTYARIQDIHVTANIVERWLGLASVSIQTASGSASPEMTIVGLSEHEMIRDFLYRRMRGARGQKDDVTTAPNSQVAATSPTSTADALAAIRDELNRAAAAIEEKFRVK